MDLNPQDYISIQEILADVLVALNDEDQHLLTPGFYNATVKLGLDSMGYDIPFLEVPPFDVEMPDDLMIPMPKGCYNLRSITIYTGTPDDVGYVENVYWRKNARNRGKGTGFTARVNAYNISDPFIRVYVNEYSLYYFTVQNGVIHLSDACQYYDYVRLVYNGIPSKNLDSVKMIPPQLQEALVLYTVERCAGFLKLKDNKNLSHLKNWIPMNLHSKLSFIKIVFIRFKERISGILIN